MMYYQWENSELCKENKLFLHQNTCFFLRRNQFCYFSLLPFTVSILHLVTCTLWLYAFKMLFSAPSTQQSTNLSNMFRGLQIKNLKYLKFEAEVSYKHVFLYKKIRVSLLIGIVSHLSFSGKFHELASSILKLLGSRTAFYSESRRHLTKSSKFLGNFFSSGSKPKTYTT